MRSEENLITPEAIRNLRQVDGDVANSFLFHTEQSRESHDWQQQVTEAIRTGLVELAKQGKPEIIRLIEESWSDLQSSVEADGGLIPELKTVEAMVLNVAGRRAPDDYDGQFQPRDRRTAG